MQEMDGTEDFACVLCLNYNPATGRDKKGDLITGGWRVLELVLMLLLDSCH